MSKTDEIFRQFYLILIFIKMNTNLTVIYFQVYLSNLIFVNYLAILEVFIELE